MSTATTAPRTPAVPRTISGPDVEQARHDRGAQVLAAVVVAERVVAARGLLPVSAP